MVSLRIRCALLLSCACAVSAHADFLERVVVLQQWTGEQAGDQFGWVTSRVGDQDGDGIDDLLITAPTNDEGGNNAGKVYVYSSVSGQLLNSFTGLRFNDQLGNNIADVGPIDADSTHDVLIGAPGAARGRAFLYSGASGAELHRFVGEAPGDQFGASVRSAGDLNNDGVQEFLIGAPSHAGTGRVYVYDGAAPYALLGTMDGQANGDQFGSIVAPLGDQDGDGVADLGIGAPGVGNGGEGYVYSGATFTRLCTLRPRAAANNFAALFMASPGDINNDGVPDIYTSDFSDGPGRAYFFSFDGGACGEILRLRGDTPGAGFGIGNATAGDVDLDGIPDIVIGAWQDNSGANSAGSASVFRNDGTLLRKITSTTAGETFGFDAHTMGDVNGDGWPDYLISAGWNNANGPQTGVVYLIAGESPFCTADFDQDGEVGLGDLGLLLASFGAESADEEVDLNGDGRVDLSDLAALLAEYGRICLQP